MCLVASENHSPRAHWSDATQVTNINTIIPALAVSLSLTVMILGY